MILSDKYRNIFITLLFLNCLYDNRFTIKKLIKTNTLPKIELMTP